MEIIHRSSGIDAHAGCLIGVRRASIKQPVKSRKSARSKTHISCRANSHGSPR